MGVIRYVENPTLDNAALNRLFAAGNPEHEDCDYRTILDRSLVYIAAFESERLIGFVHVAWDGGVHGFLLDPTVHPEFRLQGIGLELVRLSVAAATARGLEWLHVDFEPALARFYERAGFRPTAAGLIRLNDVR